MKTFFKKTRQIVVNGKVLHETTYDALYLESTYNEYKQTDCCIEKTQSGRNYALIIGDIPKERGEYSTFRGDEIKEVYISTPVEVSDEEALKRLNHETPETIRRFFPNAHYVVTRSFMPEDKRPWRRIGRRSYLWLVSLEERDLNKGRRIEWGGDTTLHATRKDALDIMYK